MYRRLQRHAEQQRGEYVSLGTYNASVEFSSASPCPRSESVTIPVNTAAVADGQHELTVTVTDARVSVFLCRRVGVVSWGSGLRSGS